MKNGFSILIVDDNKAARDSLDMLLEPEGYELQFCDDGRRAIDFARDYRPDLILLDLMMPEVDGYEVCRNIRKDPHISDIPIIIITAIDDRETSLRGLRAGADDFISKPVDRSELRLKIQNIADMNRFRNTANARERFDWLAWHTSDAVFILDEDGFILSANSPGQELLSLPEALKPGDQRFLDAVSQQFALEPPELWLGWPNTVSADADEPRFLTRSGTDEPRLSVKALVQRNPDTSYVVLVSKEGRAE